MGILAFIALGAGLLIPIVGLVIVAIAFVRINMYNQRGIAFAIAFAIAAMFVSAANWGIGSAMFTQSFMS
ncbi:hypothetical protein G7066_13965 [Leucobacter coleopterorum]|uniref:DUF4190 domain-containing protein n=1 Tax=Leucobacter coleopterorum TaxID=2714933 RepID=A0ABX6K0L3_9MICO|nr:hypothetical protein [Leucobacter coleopterorum]QIM19403.1 hypothetical protein G7066_13965 [Leucobacter coleopterorum]